jgi:virginiamycin B lyase
MMRTLSLVILALALAAAPAAGAEVRVQSYPVPKGAHPHDVAPDPAGGAVWYTAQWQGALGRLDPATGQVRHIPLGEGSRPHGVIVGPGGRVWITDGGLDAIVAVDPETAAVTRYPLPAGRRNANLNTAAFDGAGVLWFTGQNGIYGRLDPKSGRIDVFDAPRGIGPYGIDATPQGDIWFVSLAGSYLGRVERGSGKVEVIDPPTADAGLRRVWSDSRGVLWISQWTAGQLARYDPSTGVWKEWKLPGDDPAAYSVCVDAADKVWISDFGANAMLRFDPLTEAFEAFPIPRRGADVRQMLGRKGEMWAAESGTDMLTVYRHE